MSIAHAGLPVSHEEADRILAGVTAGLPRPLGAAVTHIERGDDVGRYLLRRADRMRRSPVIGITGPPGAGKSTLVSRLVSAWRASGMRVAVVAVDPSSPNSGGAILGDRLRMAEHRDDEGTYIRSMSSRGCGGGLAARAPSVARFLAGVFDRVVIETVGVGQSDIGIAGVANTTVLVLSPGAGDEVQIDKAGILEIADVLVVNKADKPDAANVIRDLHTMLELVGPRADGWTQPVVATQATTQQGLQELLLAIADHQSFTGARRNVNCEGAQAPLEAAALDVVLADLRHHIALAASEAVGDDRTPEVVAHEALLAILETMRRP